LAAVLVLRHSFPGAAGGNGSRAGPLDPGSVLVGQDLEAQSRELDRQWQSTDAHREVFDRLSADLIAGRRALPEAGDGLADVSRPRRGEWLRDVGRRSSGRSEQASRPAGGPPAWSVTRDRVREGRGRFAAPPGPPGGSGGPKPMRPVAAIRTWLRGIL